MFTREEASRIREEFWTTFGKYMSPVPSSEGMKISWVNYHTGIKDVHFRMEANQRSAAIFISLEQRDAGVRELYFEQLLEFKTLLHAWLAEEWEWQGEVVVNRKVISRVCKEIVNISVFNKEQWPELISFFKPRIMALDSFWENARYTFEKLK
jgi:hypothetical protein